MDIVTFTLHEQTRVFCDIIHITPKVRNFMGGTE